MSYTSLWYMSESSATLYSLTGGMNKVSASGTCLPWTQLKLASSGLPGLNSLPLPPRLQVVVASLGIMLFNESSDWKNLVSIAIGLIAGVVFVFAKT